jgi:hypothetical protein
LSPRGVIRGTPFYLSPRTSSTCHPERSEGSPWGCRPERSEGRRPERSEGCLAIARQDKVGARQDEGARQGGGA